MYYSTIQVLWLKSGYSWGTHPGTIIYLYYYFSSFVFEGIRRTTVLRLVVAIGTLGNILFLYQNVSR